MITSFQIKKDKSFIAFKNVKVGDIITPFSPLLTVPGIYNYPVQIPQKLFIESINKSATHKNMSSVTAYDPNRTKLSYYFPDELSVKTIIDEPFKDSIEQIKLDVIYQQLRGVVPQIIVRPGVFIERDGNILPTNNRSPIIILTDDNHVEKQKIVAENNQLKFNTPINVTCLQVVANSIRTAFLRINAEIKRMDGSRTRISTHSLIEDSSIIADGQISFIYNIMDEKTLARIIQALNCICGVACTSLFEGFVNPIQNNSNYDTAKVTWNFLSNKWLIHPTIFHLVLGLARAAYRFGYFDHMNKWQTSEDECIETVFTYNVDRARKIMEKNKAMYLQLFKCSYEGQAVDKAYEIFFNGLKTRIANPLDIENNWQLSSGLSSLNQQLIEWRYIFNKQEKI